jgi:hypothetical protein
MVDTAIIGYRMSVASEGDKILPLGKKAPMAAILQRNSLSQ